MIPFGLLHLHSAAMCLGRWGIHKMDITFSACLRCYKWWDYVRTVALFSSRDYRLKLLRKCDQHYISSLFMVSSRSFYYVVASAVSTPYPLTQIGIGPKL